MERVMRTDYPGRLEAAEGLDHVAELDAFLREVEKRAYRIALVTVRDADETLDIVQEAMLSLALRYARRPADEWRPLFYRILKNKVRDWHRRAAVRGRIISLVGTRRPDDADPIAAAAGPATDEPVDRLVAGDAMEALADGLRQLPARQREAFMLRNWEGLNVEETAAAMACSPGSVKTHLSRAVARLRELLGDEWQ